MKICKNCGVKLDDDAVFCDECGTKQETVPLTNDDGVSNSTEITQNESPAIEEPKLKEIKLSEESKTSKREIKSWLLVLLLVICSPLVLIDLILFLPDFLFWVLFVGLQLFVIVLMWRKRSWKTWIKLGVTIGYILMYVI